MVQLQLVVQWVVVVVVVQFVVRLVVVCLTHTLPRTESQARNVQPGRPLSLARWAVTSHLIPLYLIPLYLTSST